MAKDPVCGMTVTRRDMAGETEYQGRTYYFCSPACKERFDHEPQRFVVHARERSADPAGDGSAG